MFKLERRQSRHIVADLLKEGRGICKNFPTILNPVRGPISHAKYELRMEWEEPELSFRKSIVIQEAMEELLQFTARLNARLNKRKGKKLS
jgi:hypothetical protein